MWAAWQLWAVLYLWALSSLVSVSTLESVKSCEWSCNFSQHEHWSKLSTQTLGSNISNGGPIGADFFIWYLINQNQSGSGGNGWIFQIVTCTCVWLSWIFQIVTHVCLALGRSLVLHLSIEISPSINHQLPQTQHSQTISFMQQTKLTNKIARGRSSITCVRQ